MRIGGPKCGHEIDDPNIICNMDFVFHCETRDDVHLSWFARQLSIQFHANMVFNI